MVCQEASHPGLLSFSKAAASCALMNNLMSAFSMHAAK